MVRLFAIALFFLAFAADDVGNADQRVRCRCPGQYSMYGYQEIFMGQFLPGRGVLICIARGVSSDVCPEGSTFDRVVELCIGDVRGDGSCPEGMWKALYKDICLADRNEVMKCPEGGSFNTVLGICVAPCMVERFESGNGGDYFP